jgi:hypothetical protein
VATGAALDRTIQSYACGKKWGKQTGVPQARHTESIVEALLAHEAVVLRWLLALERIGVAERRRDAEASTGGQMSTVILFLLFGDPLKTGQG